MPYNWREQNWKLDGLEGTDAAAREIDNVKNAISGNSGVAK